MKFSDNNILVIILIMFIAVTGFILFSEHEKSKAGFGIVGEVHEHADFKVYLNGIAFNFSQEKYMSSKSGYELSDYAHLHDMDGDIIHKHAAGVTLGYFFNTLGMVFNSTCFVTDDGKTYCNNGVKSIKLYINGRLNYEFEDYKFHDLDRILITYGNDNNDEIKEQLDSVVDKACIQSGKCPERGKPDDESSCTSGNGCGIGAVKNHSEVEKDIRKRIADETLRLEGVSLGRNITVREAFYLAQLVNSSGMEELQKEFNELEWLIEHNYPQHVLHTLGGLNRVALNQALLCPLDSFAHVGIYLKGGAIDLAKDTEKDGEGTLALWILQVQQSKALNASSYPGSDELVAAMRRVIADMNASNYSAAIIDSAFVEQREYC